ncbi:cytochrome P450 704C1-like [Andrographis paniculata]|uniref:cytochrome P450 704C1-like n=1 Tax=Andrographis paniculata TaxID=175694 RepID=UPI0021E9A6D6|nr:cytochrome P450 704C1-like [Andrographis paniculata]
MYLLLQQIPIFSATFLISITTLSLFFIYLIVRREFGFGFGFWLGKKRYHPVGGTILNQLLNFNRLHDYITDLARKHRTYRLITHNPFKDEVYTSDPRNVEHMLKTKFDNYGKGWYNHSMLKDLLGDGIFTVDGEKWLEQRKASSHEFSGKALRDTSGTVFKRNAVKLANIVLEASSSDQPLDIQDLFMKSTLDSIFKVAFGVELDSMCSSTEEGAQFSHAFDDASALIAWRYVDVLWKTKKFLNIGLEAKLKEHIKVVDDFVYKVIHRKIQQMQDHRMESKKEDILSRFLQLSKTDPKYLRDIILNFVMAGKDTTATTLSWFFYMLCKHPHVQETVAEEISDIISLKPDETIQEFGARLCEEALDKMHNLHSALTETLRLYPPVPVDPKLCLADDTFPDGYQVKKGDVVAYLPYAMGRMKGIWGDDAEEFKPERWLDENGRFQQQSPFKFTAFQAGPRICLGKEFAYRQMKILSAVLLRFFIFKLSDEKKPVKYRTMINLHINGGLHIHAFRRYNKKST